MNPVLFRKNLLRPGGSTQTNIAANLAIIGTMQVKNSEGAVEYEDPRLAAFFQKTKAVNISVVFQEPTIRKSTSKLQDWCRPVATFDMPVYLITVSEVEFFKALNIMHDNTGSAADAATRYATISRALLFASANA